VIKRREMIQGLIAGLSSSLSAGRILAKNDDRSATRTGDGPATMSFDYLEFNCAEALLDESTEFSDSLMAQAMMASRIC